MQKIFTILVIALSLKAVTMQAQTIPNSGFETLNPDGSLANWGNVYLVPMSLDSNGTYNIDSIVYDNQFYAPTNEAFGGSKALELRNAWNFTTNTGIAGAVGCDDDSVFSSWGLLNLVPTNATPVTPFAPSDFGFYYKYFPVNGDSAFAQIALWDSSGNQLAQGTLIITDSANSYTLAYAPVNYSVAGYAAFFSYTISTFYSSAPGSHQPGFGTRLLVDNIGFNYGSTTGFNTISQDSQFKIYPNPVSDRLKIDSRLNEAYIYTIRNITGQVVSEGQSQLNSDYIPAAACDNGIYIIEITAGKKTECHSFIIKK